MTKRFSSWKQKVLSEPIPTSPPIEQLKQHTKNIVEKISVIFLLMKPSAIKIGLLVWKTAQLGLYISINRATCAKLSQQRAQYINLTEFLHMLI